MSVEQWLAGKRRVAHMQRRIAYESGHARVRSEWLQRATWSICEFCRWADRKG